MPADANHIRKVYERYPEMVTKGDVDGIVDLYAENAWIEDPIGSDKHVGIDAIRDFYAGTAGTVQMKATGPVRVAAGQAATPLIVIIGPEDGDQMVIDIISQMNFDDAGKIASMRAYWSADAIRPRTDDD